MRPKDLGKRQGGSTEHGNRDHPQFHWSIRAEATLICVFKARCDIVLDTGTILRVAEPLKKHPDPLGLLNMTVKKTKLPLVALCSLSKLWAIWFHSPPEDRSRYWWFVRLCAVRQEVDALCFLMKRHQGLISSRKESLIADLSGQEENLTSAFVNGRGLSSTLKNSSTAVCPKAGYKKHSATHRTLLVVRTQHQLALRSLDLLPNHRSLHLCAQYTHCCCVGKL